MKRWPVFILLIVLLASCSSFSRVKYGHVRKVPAETVAVPAVAVPAPVAVAMAASVPVPDAVVIQDTVNAVELPCADSFPVAALHDEIDRGAAEKITSVSTQIKPLRTAHRLRLHTATGLPPDLQLFFAIIYIVLAILFLLLCIFVIPYVSWPWLLILLAEALLLYSAWKLIISAVTFFRAHFGKRRSYLEH